MNEKDLAELLIEFQRRQTEAAERIAEALERIAEHQEADGASGADNQIKK